MSQSRPSIRRQDRCPIAGFRSTSNRLSPADKLLRRTAVSHITGTIQILGAPLMIGPGITVFNPPASPAPGGTKYLVLHFQNLNFQPGDELQVNLGYDIDRFTAADGPSFWTRPVNVYAFPAGVQITYVAAGPATGSVQLDQYGRGEEHQGETGHPSFSNCDPFYQGQYQEPTAYDPFWYCK